jgi:hypothetical protein
MPQSCEIFICDSFNDKPAAFGFSPQAGHGHAAIWKSNLRRNTESKRRVMPKVSRICAHGDALRNPSTARV